MSEFSHTDFNRAFAPGSIFQWSSGDTAVSSLIEAGQLVLPSGGIVACDPGLMASYTELTPFEPACRPGAYPVSLAVVTFQHDETAGQRVACARLQLTAEPSVRWEPALRTGQDLGTLGIGQFFGFDVDTGLGGLLDFTTLQIIWRAAGDFYSKAILPSLPADPHQLAWSNIVVDPASGANIIVYASGFGDGSYASYWGFDAQDNRCCLVTDFDLLTEPLVERFQIPLGQALAQPIRHAALTMIDIDVAVTAQPGDELHVAIRGQTPDLCGIKLSGSDGEQYAKRSHISDQEHIHIYTVPPDRSAGMTIAIKAVVGTRPL